MSSTRTVAAVTPLNQQGSTGMRQHTPEWPQIWVGTPTGPQDSGAAYRFGTEPPVVGMWVRWSEDGELWYHDPRFEDPFDVTYVAPNAVQVSGTLEV